MTAAEIGAKLALLNACLNGASALQIILGGLAIRRLDRATHKRRMVGAVATSALFLVSYLTRVAITGTHRYTGQGLLRTVYYTILTSHTLLAMTVPFLVGFAIVAAIRDERIKGDFSRHKRIVKFAYPIWLYVSITGVLVYLMLYGPTWS